jgi:molybdopterin-biosynthesis enzyme MoeA-like protein
VVGDEERAIIDALNALRRRYTYVFTTGGIGPTHGDITADCVAKAFGVPIDSDPRALAILHEWVRRRERDSNHESGQPYPFENSK